MKSAAPGRNTSAVEVTNVSAHGLWLLVDGRELFLSFREFPWFADATIRQIADVRRPSAHHLHWPALDVDLALESIEHPERYPLISRGSSDRHPERVRADTTNSRGRSRR